jgi:hypothetical protein
MTICPVCDDKVSELITDPRLDEPVCYYCARDLLDLNVHPQDAASAEAHGG